MSSPDVIFQYPKYKKTVKNPLEVFWNLFPIKMKDVLVVDRNEMESPIVYCDIITTMEDSSHNHDGRS